MTSLLHFERSVRLRYKFGHSAIPFFYIPNPYYEPPEADRPLETYLYSARMKMAQLLEQPVTGAKSRQAPHLKSTINTTVRNAIASLRQKHDIIVKPADKNLGVVVCSRLWYEAEALKQLTDEATYIRLKQPPPLDTTTAAIKTLLMRHQLLFTYEKGILRQTDMAKYMLQNQHRSTPAKFYLTIKMHKTPPVGRPICAAIGTPTYFASKWLDHVLQPLLTKIPSYLKNSSDLLLQLEQLKLPTNITLVTADVESLYPNIPTTPGLSALETFLRRHKNHLDPGIPITFIVSMAKIVLERNYLQFGDTYWLQQQGTAMGTPFAVAYANIFLGELEFQITQQYPTATPLYFRRYIDDLFLIFDDAVGNDKDFLKAYGTLYPTIKLTVTAGDSVNFLDLVIHKATRFSTTNILDFSIHQKLQNLYQYLPPFSCHPPSTIRGFIQSEINRGRRNCTNNDEFLQYTLRFRKRLTQRGYSLTYLRRFNWNPSRTALLDKLVNNFNTASHPSKSVPCILKTLWNPRHLLIRIGTCLQLPQNPAIENFFNGRQPIICYKQPRNLGQYLTRATHQHAVAHLLTTRCNENERTGSKTERAGAAE